MDAKDNTGIASARNTLDDIPEPSANAKEIIGLVKQGGKVTGYQLSDERIVDKEEGVALAKAGEIAGVGIAHRKGTEYLKSIPGIPLCAEMMHMNKESCRSKNRIQD